MEICNKAETIRLWQKTEKSRRYQVSSQALPDNSYLSADRLFDISVNERRVGVNRCLSIFFMNGLRQTPDVL